MRNEEKFKTAEERCKAHDEYCLWIRKCNNNRCPTYSNGVCSRCVLKWLDMDYIPDPLPCPFCGCEDIRVRKGSDTLGMYAVCNDCGCRTNEIESDVEAIEAWNRRAK